MTHSTPGKTPSSKRLASREGRSSPDSRKPTVRISPELASLLAAEDTRLIMEADNVGMEQLVAALTRIPIPRRKNKTPHGKA
jgi:hypothetical protein